MKHRLALLVLAATTAYACSERTLTPDRAASLIRDLDQFKREAHVTIQTGVPFQSLFRCLSQAEVERTPLTRFLVERGWVRFEVREATLGLGAKAPCPAMALTAAGHTASAQWARGRSSSTEETTWAVPVARRELLGVAGLSIGPDGSAQVEFDWKWTPNETGAALRESIDKASALFEQVRKSRASCRRTDEGWRCRLGMWTTPADAGELSL
jgi:hypothetical protein